LAARLGVDNLRTIGGRKKDEEARFFDEEPGN